MLERIRVIHAALALSLVGSDALPAAPNPSLLAECKLDFKAAKARLKAMKPIGKEDMSGEEMGWIITRYDPSKLRPLGMKALAFEHEELTDEDGTAHYLNTTVEAGFAPARDAVLASFGSKQCFQPFAAPIPLDCMVAVGNSATGKPGVWVNAQRGKVQIKCRYEPSSG
jgi:hypothetical protein